MPVSCPVPVLGHHYDLEVLAAGVRDVSFVPDVTLLVETLRTWSFSSSAQSAETKKSTT